MRKISGVLVALGLLVVLVQAPPAAAGTRTHSDPNDAAGPLDIKAVKHGHSGDRLLHKVSTYGKWGPRHLRGKNRIILVTKTGGTVEKGYIWWKNGGWYCKIPTDARKCSKMPGLTVARPNGKSLVIKNVPPPGKESYRYRIGTRFQGRIDWAPGKGKWFKHLH